jgi:hypothetical protein
MNKKNKIGFFCLLLWSHHLLASVATAPTDFWKTPPLPNGNDPDHVVKPATVDCVIHAAEKYSVPANILLAIASVERGKNGQRVKNQNGSTDLGHFQINTVHWRERGGIFYQTGITKNDVLWRGCYAAELAAWMIEGYTIADNNNYWSAVARYHSATPKYNKIYRDKVMDFAVEWGDWLQQHYPQDKVNVTYKPTK